VKAPPFGFVLTAQVDVSKPFVFRGLDCVRQVDKNVKEKLKKNMKLSLKHSTKR
jgi:hypothetical protein